MTVRLEYFTRRRARWPRVAALGLLVAAVLTAGGYVYVHVLAPRWQQARYQAALQASFDRALFVAAHRTSPVAVILSESLLRHDPDLIDRYGHISSYRDDDRFASATDPHALRVRLLQDAASARLFFCTSSTVFLGKRRAGDGREYVVALDVVENGRGLEFHTEFIDPAAASGVSRTVSRVSGVEPGTVVAEFTFAEQPASTFVMSGVSDPVDPGRFSFEVVHGDARDTVRCAVGAPGVITVEPTVDPGVENRWRVSSASRVPIAGGPATRPQ